jgi:predicted DNA-binding protein with PD1-like motif
MNLRQVLRAVVSLQLALAIPGIAAESAPAVHTIPSPIERVVVVRLKHKTDVLDGLKQAIEREKIKNAVIISGFGSVGAYHIHVVNSLEPPYKDVYAKAVGPFDILTVSGMVIDGKIHAHITLSNPQKTTGGHIEPGTSVLTFTSITLGILSDSASLARIDDPEWR